MERYVSTLYLGDFVINKKIKNMITIQQCLVLNATIHYTISMLWLALATGSLSSEKTSG